MDTEVLIKLGKLYVGLPTFCALAMWWKDGKVRFSVGDWLIFIFWPVAGWIYGYFTP